MPRSARTRDRLQTCALDLFERQGFDATTVEQIARAAGVTEMTFFRHFATKEGLLVDDPYDPIMVTALARQPRDRPPLRRVTAGIREAWRQLPEPEGETVRRRVRIAAALPSLRGAIAANNARSEAMLVEQLVADGTDPFTARVVASAVLAGITAAIFEWSRDEEMSLGAAVNTALDTLDDHHG
jgi:AcrR family transcriptional regulator